MRRMALALLALALAAAAASGAALAEAGGELVWNYARVDGGAALTRFGSDGRPVGEVELPSEIDGLRLVEIGNFAFSFCDGVTGVTVPSGVARIGDYAFSNCADLARISFGEGLASIGYGAMGGCAALADIALPDGLESIGDMAFALCKSLGDLYVPPSVTSIGDDAFKHCGSIRLIVDGGSYAEEYAIAKGVPYALSGAEGAVRERPVEREIASENPVVVIEMESGAVMRVELYPDAAPNTALNFLSLVEGGFYDGLIFHRVISGFMIQGGCPLGTGTGGPGYNIKGEFEANGVRNDLKHTRGVISMARSQPYDSAGSQFFIMHAAAPHLDGSYAAFGKLVGEESYATLDAIAAARTGANDRPASEQRMARVYVESD